MYVSNSYHSLTRTELEKATLDFMEKAERCTSSTNVTTAFQEFALCFGMQNVAAVTMPASGTLTSASVLMNTRSEAWSAAYLEQDCFSRDPMVRHLPSATRAFTWSDVTSRRNLDSEEHAVMSLAHDFGMDSGLIIPLYQTKGPSGLVSLAGLRIDLTDDMRYALSLAGAYVHNKLSMMRSRSGGQEINLTEREIEVLHWIAEGKSDWQIGQILNISAKTVNYHVENVKRKFSVASRIQAVVAAIRAGVLN